MFCEAKPVRMSVGIDDAEPPEGVFPAVGERQGISDPERQGGKAEGLQELAAVQRVAPLSSAESSSSISSRIFSPSSGEATANQAFCG